jgi:peptidoglycan/xylan/chitin deacetylase (PgdA/CDA1 family)
MHKYRIDRDVSLKLVKPLRRMAHAAQSHRIPILMYHGIRTIEGDSHPYYETRTAPKMFAAQMRHLLDRGYRAVDLEQATELLTLRADTSRIVAITFDDGFLDFYSSAFPVLLECGFSATVYVMPAFIQGAAQAASEHAYMSWDEIREVQEYGIRIGSHTMNHAELVTLPWKKIERELADSRDAIIDALGGSVPSFSYPYAFPEHQHSYIRDVTACLKNLGYRNAVTTIIGSAATDTNPYLLPRIPINTHDDLDLFDAKLSGAYDWMHAVQFARKLLRKPVSSKLCQAATAVAL